MTRLIEIHGDNPQQRLVAQAVAAIRKRVVVAYPTDSSYALGCLIDDKISRERIRRLRGQAKGHTYTLVCRDLSEIASYGLVDNTAYRFMRKRTPGAFTFVLRATREVPKRLQDSRRRTVGIRVPDHPVTLALLEQLGEPLLSTTLTLPGADLPLTDPQDIRDQLSGRVDLIVDGGMGGIEPTTVIDLAGDTPTVLRAGKGDLAGVE